MKQRRPQGLPSAKKPDKSNQCQSGVHPNLVGQTAARCGLQSGKSARRLFSMLHLKAIRALTPLSTSGASPSLSSKNGTAPPPSQAAAAHTFVGRTETSLGLIARAGRAIECKSRRKTNYAVTDQQQIACEKRSKPTSCRAMYLCCDGPTPLRDALRLLSLQLPLEQC